MGVELKGSAVEQLRDIARMAWGSGRIGEGEKGGAGNIGMIGNHVVKYNTHRNERGGEVTNVVRNSAVALRTHLLSLAGNVLGKSPEQAATMRKVMDLLGINGSLSDAELDCTRSLLDRKVVAKVISLLDRETHLDLWQTSGRGDSSTGIRTTFDAVRKSPYETTFPTAKLAFPKASESETRRQTELFVTGTSKSITFTAKASHAHVRDANAEYARVYPAEKYSAEPIADDDEAAWMACTGQFEADLTRNFCLVVDGRLYGDCPLSAPGAQERFAQVGATKVTGELTPGSRHFTHADRVRLRNELKSIFTKDGAVDWRMLRQFCLSIHQGTVMDLFTTAEMNKNAPVPYGVEPTSSDKHDQNKYMVVTRDATGNVHLTFDTLDKPSLLINTPTDDTYVKLDEDRSSLQRKATVVFSPGQPPRVEEGSVEYSVHLVKGKFAPPPPALERIRA